MIKEPPSLLKDESSLTGAECYEFGCLHEQGIGIKKEKNFDKAVYFYEKAVGLHYDKAKVNLAFLYLRGYQGSLPSVADAKKRAYQLCDEVSEHYPRAMYLKAFMLKEGEGVENNFEESLKCFQKAKILYNTVRPRTQEQSSQRDETLKEIENHIEEIDAIVKMMNLIKK